MASNCSNNEQIKRDGASQAGRYLAMLDPANAPLDDRSPEDILVFAKHYADLVRFYDIDEMVEWADTTDEDNNAEINKEKAAKKPVYTWKEFFYKDIAVVVASIAQYKDKLPLIKQEYDDKRMKVDSNPTIENYKELFKSITHLLHRINKWYSRSIDDHPLKNELALKIHSTLAPALKKLVSYDKGSEVVKDNGLEIKKEYDLFKTGFLHVDYDAVQKDESIYEVKDKNEKIKHAALYVDDIFQEVLKVYKELTDRSEYYFKAALENYPEHQPHMALFLAFVQLFSYAQKEMNGLTQRHLEFYYRDVLHLQERAASPDAVYLIYELAKEATEYDLKAGTALTAGKDATGKELIYKTENELVINKAKVKELKTIFLDKDSSVTPDVIKKIYAAPVAKSADGNGTPFTVAESAWAALGYFTPEFDSAQNIKNKIGEEAEIGFAIASPQLFLAEGVRTITVEISLDKEADFSKNNLMGTMFTIQLTGEKGWVNFNNVAPANIKTVNDRPLADIQSLQLKITIPASEQSIVAYNEKLHGTGFKNNFPVVKIVLNNSLKYNPLKEIRITDTVSISVEVTGVKNLILSNDDGAIELAKPYNPFSLTPKPGSGLIIGSREVFSKRLTKLSLVFNRKMNAISLDAVDSVDDSIGDTLKINLELYYDRKWVRITKLGVDLFDTSLTKLSDKNTDPALTSFNRTVDLSADFSIQKSSFGFLRASLHFSNEGQVFDADVNQRLIDKELVDRFRLYSALALLLETNELTINYSSSQIYEADTEEFFHLFPFGNLETFPVEELDTSEKSIFDEQDKKNDNLLVKTSFLLPQFKFGVDVDRERTSPPDVPLADLQKDFFKLNQYDFEIHQQGNLFIGIENLSPPQNLSLLFKIADGTAEDNDSEPPKINWSYLVNNEWRPLPSENIISDSTYGLQATGIILFDFPADATNNNTVVSKDLHWLCASVDKDADRIPKIIDVIAQANKAVFYDQQNDPLHYKMPLPAQSVAKLSIKVPEVKVVQQPFESFDGKMREEGKVFYARASERLRHKHRAITPWDYEHLVLQHFPAIYKVKCLTHTDPECICRHPKINNAVDKLQCCCGQVAPGHILIVPVSNLRNKNAVDILKPRTGRRTLLQIEEYLKKLTSPFVHVHAKNPKFEEIKTAFNVKFYTGTDKGRYLKQLNEDIIQFLTPWAFDANREVIFGGNVYASAVINFIEELDYVDYITCFRMIHIVKGCCETDTLVDLPCTDMKKKIDDTILADVELKKRFLNVVEATSPQAILTSAKKHCIELIIEPKEKDKCNCS